MLDFFFGILIFRTKHGARPPASRSPRHRSPRQAGWPAPRTPNQTRHAPLLAAAASIAAGLEAPTPSVVVGRPISSPLLQSYPACSWVFLSLPDSSAAFRFREEERSTRRGHVPSSRCRRSGLCEVGSSARWGNGFRVALNLDDA